LAGIDLDTLRELYGHTSKMMTMRYAKVVKEVYRKQILEKSPDF
jgi:site-specific recombinase XerD